MIGVRASNGSRVVVAPSNIAAVFEGDSHGVELSLVNGETVWLAKSTKFADVVELLMVTEFGREVTDDDVRQFLESI